MNSFRFASRALLALVLSSTAVPAQDANAERQKRFEELRKKREEARKAAAEKSGSASTGTGGAATATGGVSGGGGSAAKAGATASGGKAAGGQSAGGQTAGGQAGQGGKSTAAPATNADAQLEELRKTRNDRRKAAQQQLRERWGAALDNPRSRDELKLHGRRLAELARLRSLFEAQKNVSQLTALDKLLTREELRHGRVMNEIRTAGGTR